MNKSYILERAYKLIPERRLKHTEGVVKTALHLAELYGEDRDKTEIAAACHDMYRIRDPEELNDLIDRYGIPERYRNNPALAHSKIAARALEMDFGLEDGDIISAVEFHTTGRWGMSRLERIIYLADGIEPGRDYPGVEELRIIAERDLDGAVLEALEHSVEHVRSEGIPVEKDSLEAIEYMKTIKGELNEQ